MKYILPWALAVAMTGSALAQTPATNPDPKTPAVTGTESPRPAAPAKGANSFTMEQAKERIQARGFTNVMGLKKDNDGVWKGRADKGGMSHDVALDYQGNVFPH